MPLPHLPAWQETRPVDETTPPVTRLAAELPAAFQQGDVDVRLHVAANGFGYSPLSIVTSFVGWTEFGFASDAGLLELPSLSVGIGVEGYYSRPWLAELVLEGLVDATSDTHLDVDVWNAGLLARVSLHLTESSIEVPKSMDPYAVALLGPTFGRFSARWTLPDGSIGGGSEEYGMRTGVGVGSNFLTESGLFAGVELRYLVGFNFRQTTDLSVTDESGTVYEYHRSSWDRPPRGFGWVISIGMRL